MNRNNRPPGMPHDPAIERMIREKYLESMGPQQHGPVRVQLPPQLAQLPDRVDELADIVHVLTEMLQLVMPPEVEKEMVNRLDAMAEQRHIQRLPRTPVVLWSTERLVPEVVAALDRRRGEDGTEQHHAFLMAAPDSPIRDKVDGRVFIETEMGKALHAASSFVLAEKWRAHKAGAYTDEQLRPCDGDAPLPPQLAEKVRSMMSGHDGDFAPRAKIEVVR